MALAALTCLLALPALAQTGDVAKGKAAFEDRCTMCHGPGRDGQGPKLAGVVGRRAGSAAGFPYSAALKASGLVWTPANLEKFLAGPSKLVPGTAMTVTVSDPAQRRDIVAYLASLKR
ncbi:MAG: c-type cytochrome [Caulobacteraceae bacterium]